MTAPLPPFPPLAPATPVEGGLDAIAGLRTGTTGADIKGNKKVRDDVLVLALDRAVAGAAVTTRSTAAAAPCRWTRARVPGPVRAVVCNAGNANASTGTQGERDTEATAARVAEGLGCSKDQVLVCSTGVIGVPMPMERMLPGVDRAIADLGKNGANAARAILTTDLVQKVAAYRVGEVTVAGIAKGSGMIHPNMATMLGFFATDADVEPAHLQALLEAVNARTFNAVTVDGDMSTNDTAILLATGTGASVTPGSASACDLELALEHVMRDLARAIARDGEGATTLVEVALQGGPDDATAREGARAVIRSPLVKSAIHGRDPNWGRVVGALGAAGMPGLDQCDLDFAGVPVLRNGQPTGFDEARASTALKAPEVTIRIVLPGPGKGLAWGCDLSADYVKINADYRS